MSILYRCLINKSLIHRQMKCGKFVAILSILTFDNSKTKEQLRYSGTLSIMDIENVSWRIVGPTLSLFFVITSRDGQDWLHIMRTETWRLYIPLHQSFHVNFNSTKMYTWHWFENIRKPFQNIQAYLNFSHILPLHRVICSLVCCCCCFLVICSPFCLR